MYWIWVLIPLFAIFTKFVLDFQKNQMKLRESNQDIGKQVEQLEHTVSDLIKRIENLETIAAAEPDDFTESKIISNQDNTIIKDEQQVNQEIVNKIAQKRRAKL
jgi:DNA anti-recombination protein RmuC